MDDRRGRTSPLICIEPPSEPGLPRAKIPSARWATWTWSAQRRSRCRGRLVVMGILLVEDDDPLAAALCRLLTSEDFQVTRVADGRAGLDAALAGDHELIILDLMLPGMNG
ncbi:MAG: response regulator, partial [Acidimicrobiales bacterium]|nr:response regulator [Acidimicrobiales bacterium]